MRIAARMRVGALALAAACLAGAAFAAEPLTVRAFLQPSQGFNDAEPIRLVIQIEGDSVPQVEPPRLTGLTNLSLLSGPHRKTNMTWINGRTSATLEFTYVLLADRQGAASIPGLELRIGSETYRTQPFRLQIGKAPSGPPPPGSAGREGRPSTRAAEALFLRATLGADEIWVGQPVPLTVTLFAQPRVTNFAWRKQPDFANFWVEPVAFDADAEATRATIGDRVYLAYPVDRRILIPPAPGEYEIDSYVGQVNVQLSQNDPFDWFLFGRSESILRRTDPLRLKVKDLPARGRPDDFGGAVGRYTLSASLDRAEARVDDAVALKATVRGEGALRSIGAPALEAPPDLKIFDPQVKESSVETINGRIVSSKTWEWIVVPLAPGEVRLPDLRFDFFEPESASYRSAAVGDLRLTVQRGEAGGDRVTAGGGIQLQRRELAFIKPLRGPLREHYPRAHERVSFRLLLLLPLGLAPLLVIWGRRRARLQHDLGLARGRRARARARKRFAVARRRLPQTDSATFHEEVARTLVEYLADRANRSAAGLTYEEADLLLARRGVDAELRRRFRSCLETCDFVRFVPEAAKSERRAEVLREAAELVEELERAW